MPPQPLLQLIEIDRLVKEFGRTKFRGWRRGLSSPKEINDIGFVILDQDACAKRRLPSGKLAFTLLPLLGNYAAAVS